MTNTLTDNRERGEREKKEEKEGEEAREKTDFVQIGPVFLLNIQISLHNRTRCHRITAYFLYLSLFSVCPETHAKLWKERKKNRQQIFDANKNTSKANEKRLVPSILLSE